MDVQGNDLLLRKPLDFGSGLSAAEPYLQAEATVLRGRHIMLWGQNPFHCSDRKQAVLQLTIHGEGANSEGKLRMVGRSTLDSGKPAKRLSGNTRGDVLRWCYWIGSLLSSV